MSTAAKDGTAARLFGKTRLAVLSLLYSHPDQAFYTRQIARDAGIALGALQRELKRLAESGIARRIARGSKVYYQANREIPEFNELRALLTRSHVASVAEPAASYDTTVSPEKGVKVPKHKLADLCRRHHIRKLALFGSVLRDDFGPDSDVDVLVEFEPGRTPGFAYFSIQDDLSEMFGRKVDLNTPASLSRYFRDQVAREAHTLYEEA